jgi:hypothetical protein
MFISMNYIVFVRTPMIKILDPPLPAPVQAGDDVAGDGGARSRDRRWEARGGEKTGRAMGEVRRRGIEILGCGRKGRGYDRTGRGKDSGPPSEGHDAGTGAWTQRRGPTERSDCRTTGSLTFILFSCRRKLCTFCFAS